MARLCHKQAKKQFTWLHFWAAFRKAPPNSTPYSFRKKEVRVSGCIVRRRKLDFAVRTVSPAPGEGATRLVRGASHRRYGGSPASHLISFRASCGLTTSA